MIDEFCVIEFFENLFIENSIKIEIENLKLF